MVNIILACNPNITHKKFAAFILYLEELGVGEEIWIYSSLIVLVLNIFLTVSLKENLTFGRINIPVGFILACSYIISMFLFHFPNFALGDLHVDENEHIGEGITLFHDLRFWLSVDGTTVGPLSLYPVVILNFFNIGVGYFTIRILNLFLWLLTAYVVYRIFRLKFSKVEARLFVLPLILLVGLFCSVYYVTYNGEVPTGLLIVISIYCIFRVLSSPSNKLYQFLSGLVLVLIPFGKIQVGPLALIVGITLLIYLAIQRVNFTFVLLGVILPLLPFIYYLLKYDVFYDFWQSYIVNNLSYAAKGEGLETHRGLLINFIKFPLLVLRNVETQIIFLLGFTIIISILYKVRREKIFWRTLLSVYSRSFFLFLYFILSVICISIPGNIFPHYAIFLIVPIILLNGWFYNHILNSYQGIKKNLVFAFLFCLLPSIVTIFSFHSRDRFSPKFLIASVMNNPVAEEICRLSSPEDRIATWGTDNYIFPETGLLMGTREVHTQRQILSNRQQDYYLNRYILDLEMNKPKFFIDAVHERHWLFDQSMHTHEQFPLVKEYIESRYLFHKKVENVRIYIRIDS